MVAPVWAQNLGFAREYAPEGQNSLGPDWLGRYGFLLIQRSATLGPASGYPCRIPRRGGSFLGFEIILVGLGVGVFLLSLVNFRLVYSISKGFRKSWHWALLALMILGFLGGYLVFFSYLLEVEEANFNDLLVSIIFFGGSLFVFVCSKLFLSTAADMTGALRAAAEAAEAVRLSALEQSRLEDRAVAGQRLEGIGLLASGIAHDFNNLLVGILGNSSYARRLGPDEVSDFREALEDVEEAAERAAILTQQLSAYCGHGSAHLERIDLSEMIDGTLGLMRSSINSKVTVNLDLAKDLPAVWGDSGRFRQLIMNLVRNGLEAMLPEGGELVVRAGVVTLPESESNQPDPVDALEPGVYVSFSVKDQGIGISDIDRSHVFDPFYSTKGMGRGLGLSAAQGIVSSHGGKLTLESVFGTGTTVRVLLPKAPEEVEELDSFAEARSNLVGAGRILVIDDELIVLDTIRRGLQHAGYAVDTAVTISELEKFLEWHGSDYSAVILDIMMPDINFVETFEDLRLRLPGIAILISSGHSDINLSETVKGAKNVAFLTKPYRVEALIRAVEGLGVLPGGGESSVS